LATCPFESRVSVSNGYLQSTERSAGPHQTRPVHTGLKLREICKTSGSPDAEHRTLSGASGAHRTHTQRGLQNRADTGLRTPDAPTCVRCLTLAAPGSPVHRTHRHSVQCLQDQRPVSVSQRKNTSATSPKFPTLGTPPPLQMC